MTLTGRCASPSAVLLKEKPTGMVKSVPELTSHSHSTSQRHFSALQPAFRFNFQVGTCTADKTKVHGVAAGAGANSSDILKLNVEMLREPPA